MYKVLPKVPFLCRIWLKETGGDRESVTKATLYSRTRPQKYLALLPKRRRPRFAVASTSYSLCSTATWPRTCWHAYIHKLTIPPLLLTLHSRQFSQLIFFWYSVLTPYQYNHRRLPDSVISPRRLVIVLQFTHRQKKIIQPLLWALGTLRRYVARAPYLYAP